VPSTLISGTYGNALNFSNPGNLFAGTFSGDGTNVSNVNAARLGGLMPSAYALLGQNANFAALSASTFTGDGAAITNLNASNLASGTVDDARLSNNVALITRSNTFQAGKTQIFTGDATPSTGLAGLNLAPTAGDIGKANAGDVWYNTSGGVNHLRFFDGTTPQTIAFLSDFTSGSNTFTGTNTFSGSASFSGGTSFSGNNNLVTGSLSPSGGGTITANAFMGVLPIANGGTNNALFTANKFLAFDGTRLSSTAFDSTSFIQNGTTPQTANLNISGTGTFGTSVSTTGLSAATGSITSLTSTTITGGTITGTTINGTTITGTNLSATTLFTVPVSGGAAPTTNGAIAYDSTANQFKVGVNSLTNTLALLDGGNTYTGGKQTLAAAVAQLNNDGKGYGSLNIPNGTAPQMPVTGDIWANSGSIFYNNGTSNKTLAFTDSALTGDGSGLTNLNASNISSGTLSPDRIAAGSIDNTKLTNSSILINTPVGSGLSGGSAVALGGSLTLSNAGVLSFNTRNGNVLPASGDYNFSQISGMITPGQVSPGNYLINAATSSSTAALQGIPVSATTPVTNQVLEFTGANWTPADISGNFIQNGTSQQASANFNISGSGVLGGGLTANDAVINQAKNGDDLLFGTRFTDSSPTGNLMRFRNQANSADLWSVDVNGTLTAGTIPAAQVTGTLTNNTSGNASTASALDHTPTQCGLGFATGISATGAANCSANASALTNLTAANISAGTAGINITGTASNVTGVVGTANGGTGLMLSSVAAGSYLRGNGTGFSVSPILAADIPSGSSNYIQNGTSPQASASFNIDGSGTLGGSFTVTGGKSSLAGSTATYASLNIPNGTAAPSTPVPGDFWLLSGNTHPQFRDNAGTPATHSLMFTDDTVNGTNLTAGSVANTALANSSVTVTAGTGLSGGGTVSLGNSVTLTNAGVLSLAVDGTTIINGGTAQNPSLTVGLIGGGQVVGNIAGNAANVTGTVAVANGGTGLTTGTSGGVLGFTAPGTLASSGVLDSGRLVLGGGAGATPSTSADFTTASASNSATLNLGKLGNGTANSGDLGSLFLAGSTSGGATLTSQITGGALTLQLPNTAPTTNQVLTASVVAGNTVTLGFATPNAGTLTNVTASSPLASTGGMTPNVSLTGIVPIANGGTGSSTQNFVDLTSSQVIGGPKTFSSQIIGSVSGTATTITGSIGGGQVSGDIAGNAANVNGTVAVLHGGTGVSTASANAVFAGPTTGAASAPAFRSLVAADLPTPQNTRTICYVAGADNSTGAALTTNDTQKSFFNNMIGNMTITAAKCQVDAGSVTMNVQKNNLVSAVTTSVACTSTPGTWQSLTVSGSSLALGDSLDLSITAATTAKRLTVCVAGTVN